MRDDPRVREPALTNLGSLISQAELLRTRALRQMQEAPDTPVGEADRQAYADLLAAARAVCEGNGSAAMEGIDEPDRLETVARLHRSAGLIEHELLVRLAEARSAHRRAAAQ
jgi:hypothetical protein